MAGNNLPMTSPRHHCRDPLRREFEVFNSVDTGRRQNSKMGRSPLLLPQVGRLSSRRRSTRTVYGSAVKGDIGVSEGGTIDLVSARTLICDYLSQEDQDGGQTLAVRRAEPLHQADLFCWSD